jgi:hypothetical protein
MLLLGAMFGFCVSRQLATKLDRSYTRRTVIAVAAMIGPSWLRENSLRDSLIYGHP